MPDEAKYFFVFWESTKRPGHSGYSVIGPILEEQLPRITAVVQQRQFGEADWMLPTPAKELKALMVNETVPQPVRQLAHVVDMSLDLNELTGCVFDFNIGFRHEVIISWDQNIPIQPFLKEVNGCRDGFPAQCTGLLLKEPLRVASVVVDGDVGAEFMRACQALPRYGMLYRTKRFPFTIRNATAAEIAAARGEILESPCSDNSSAT